MARLESKAIMGYLPIEERHYPALLSLVAPATPAARMLDPFAGEGAFLEAAARSWHVTPYVNELDAGRAAVCVTRFGPTHAVRCDVERLVASTESFGVVWANPPYDHDCAARDNKRVEFTYLRHAWKWAQIGGLVLWCVYQQHLTEAALAFLSTHSRTVEIWALPGKHQGEYDQVVVACIKGTADAPESLLAHLLSARLTPTPLTVQVEPRYRLPPPPEASRRFVFAPDTVDPAQGQRLIEAHGAWLTHGVQALVEVPRPVAQADPIVPPRPGHMALLLAAGVANGALLETAIYGTVAVRGKTTVRVEQVARRDVEALPHDPERQVVKTTVRLKPTTTLTLLAQDGTRVEMAGDAAILDFITQHKAALATYLNDKFRPAYAFDFNGLGCWLGSLRLRGKHPLYTAQQHVVAAITCGFQHRKGLLLVGAMGTGKTAMGGSVAVALAAGLVAALRTQVKPTQVVLIVAPPHLLDKWARELHDLAPTALVERLNHHEERPKSPELKGFAGILSYRTRFAGRCTCAAACRPHRSCPNGHHDDRSDGQCPPSSVQETRAGFPTADTGRKSSAPISWLRYPSGCTVFVQSGTRFRRWCHPATR
jgi:16S rRNA G966 N2-methylase RsmD